MCRMSSCDTAVLIGVGWIDCRRSMAGLGGSRECVAGRDAGGSAAQDQAEGEQGQQGGARGETEEARQRCKRMRASRGSMMKAGLAGVITM